MKETTISFPETSVRGIQTFLKAHLAEFERKNKGLKTPKKSLKKELERIKNKLQSVKPEDHTQKAILHLLLGLYEPLDKWCPEDISYPVFAGGADMIVESICIHSKALLKK